MRRWTTLAVTLLVVLALSIVPATAQAPGPPPGAVCDDRLREAQVNLHLTTLAQVRERAEVAREIAQLMKRAEQAEIELVAAKKALEALKAAPPPK